MSTSIKCQCGSTDIDNDSAAAEARCRACGIVLVQNILSSEVQFEENAYGGTSALGQFVSGESRGGGGVGLTGFNPGIPRKSTDVTLNRTRTRMNTAAQQLRLNQHCVDMAFNFYKMYLEKNKTMGIPSENMIGACLYLASRLECTSHMLIDICEAVQACVFEVGQTFFQMLLYFEIKPPTIDPCVYILRFASQLQFGKQMDEVSNTAMRLVTRMKRDYIHYGRRPSGLCGAALLIAARLHGFNRTPMDIIRIVKVHESTLRKRMLEFGETPSSALTLEEFMTVDLEEAQDPPSFKAARRRDRERLQKLMDKEDMTSSFTSLQREIEEQLEKKPRRGKGSKAKTEIKRPIDEVINNAQTEKTMSSLAELAQGETDETLNLHHIIAHATIETVNDYISSDNNENFEKFVPPTSIPVGLGPSLAMMGLGDNKDRIPSPGPSVDQGDGELDLDGIDEDDIDSYILKPNEVQRRTDQWMFCNREYLEEQARKEAQAIKDREEGKPEKKKRKPKKPKNSQPASTAGQAIEWMLQERKLSSKINYEVLRSLPALGASPASTSGVVPSASPGPSTKASILMPPPSSRGRTLGGKRAAPNVQIASKRRVKEEAVGRPVAVPVKPEPVKQEVKPVLEQLAVSEVTGSNVADHDYEDEEEEEEFPEEDEMSVSQMLSQRDEMYGDDDEY